MCVPGVGNSGAGTRKAVVLETGAIVSLGCRKLLVEDVRMFGVVRGRTRRV